MDSASGQRNVEPLPSSCIHRLSRDVVANYIIPKLDDDSLAVWAELDKTARDAIGPTVSRVLRLAAPKVQLLAMTEIRMEKFDIGWMSSAPRAADPWPAVSFKRHWDRPEPWRGLSLLQRWRILCLAASSGDLGGVELVLKHGGLEPTTRDDGPNPPSAPSAAAAAVDGGSLAVCGLLQRRGFVSVSRDADLARALGQSGRVDLCEWALEQVARAREHTRLSLLYSVAHWAAYHGHGALVAWISDVSRSQRPGRPPVQPYYMTQAAALGGQGELLQQLLAQGLDRTAVSWGLEGTLVDLTTWDRDLLHCVAAGCDLLLLQHLHAALSGAAGEDDADEGEGQRRVLYWALFYGRGDWRAKSSWLADRLVEAGGGEGAAQALSDWLSETSVTGVLPPDYDARVRHACCGLFGGLLDTIFAVFHEDDDDADADPWYAGAKFRWFEEACRSGDAGTVAALLGAAAPDQQAWQPLEPGVIREVFRGIMSVRHYSPRLSGVLDVLAAACDAQPELALALPGGQAAPELSAGGLAWALTRVAASSGHQAAEGAAAAFLSTQEGARTRQMLLEALTSRTLGPDMREWQTLMSLLLTPQRSVRPDKGLSLLLALARIGSIAHMEWLAERLRLCNVQLPVRLTDRQLACVASSGNKAAVDWLRERTLGRSSHFSAPHHRPALN